MPLPKPLAISGNLSPPNNIKATNRINMTSPPLKLKNKKTELNIS
jgi:hypothetical protein